MSADHSSTVLRSLADRVEDEGPRLLIERSADAILVVSAQGSTLLANPAARKLLGRSHADLVGSCFGLPVVDGDSAEIDILRPDGEHRLADMNATAIRWEGGMAWLVTMHDITERHRSQEALRLSEESFRSLAEATPDAIIVHAEGQVLYVNPAFLAMTGHCSSAALRGRPILELLHDDDRASVSARLEQLARSPGPFPMAQERFITSDGGVMLLEVATVRVQFEGRPAFTAVARDVTERVRLQAQLAHADRLASVGTLAAGVAHEINNPLTYVMFNLHRLQETLPKIAGAVAAAQRDLELTSQGVQAGLFAIDPDGIRALAERAAEAADGCRRIRDIVKTLTSFSRLEREKRTPVDVNAAIEAAMTLAGNQMKFRARLVRRLGARTTVLADEAALTQVTLNLLINAAHAIPEGASLENEIRVSSGTSGAEVWLEVADTGEGMTPSLMAHIFEPFFTTKPQGVGSGLGLWMSNNIVRAWAGRIEVDSTPGKGSRFRVYLPAHAILGPDLVPPDGSLPEAVGPSPAARILIVDDEPAVASTLRMILPREHAITVVHSGSDAIALLDSGQCFDLVIADLLMPQVSGMDLYDWVQQRQPELSRRLLFMTGGAFTERAQQFLARIERPLLEKPFDPNRVLGTVREMLRS